MCRASRPPAWLAVLGVLLALPPALAEEHGEIDAYVERLKARSARQGRALIFASAGAKPGGDGSPRRPFPTIREALARAREGDAVLALPGVYRENVRIGKGVSLLGCGCASSVIVGDATSLSGVVEGEDGARLSGFKVTSTEAGRGWGYFMRSEREVHIEDTLFAGLYVGIHCNNEAKPDPAAAAAYEPAPVHIAHNVILGCRHSAVGFGWSVAPRIERNVLLRCQGGGVWYYTGDPKASPACILKRNVIWGCGAPYGQTSREVLAGLGAKGGDLEKDPLLAAPERGDVSPRAGSPCLPGKGEKDGVGIRPLRALCRD